MPPLPDGENIVLIARKHWLVFAGSITGVVVLIIVALLLFGIGEALLPSDIIDAIGTDRLLALDLALGGGFLLIALMVLSVAFTNYYLDAIILTEKRVIDCDQKGIFRRDVAIVPIENVIDIRVEVVGLIATFFHYGSLYLQTAGESKEVIVHGLKDPQTVRDTILHAYHKDTRDPGHPAPSPIP